jgi:aminomethyltransferase
MVDFAGWELPVQYPGGIVAEHMAVRQGVGLFDVSHMGELLVAGPEALPFLGRLLTNNLRRLSAGRAVYAPMCHENGGTVDDLIVYPYEGAYLLVVNAANTDKDFAHISALAAGFRVTVRNVSSAWGQLALQGPGAAALLAALPGGGAIAALPFFGCGLFPFLGITVFSSATGYTGGPGFEFYLPVGDAAGVWDILAEAGATPCGLGARDTLRLEGALPLYGHELADDISPLEAGLSRFVKFENDFLGRAALEKQAENGPPRRLVGLVMEGRAVPRAGYAVLFENRVCGTVTSGGVAPALGRNIALALVEAEGDGPYAVDIRGRAEATRLVPLPFYKG